MTATRAELSSRSMHGSSVEFCKKHGAPSAPMTIDAVYYWTISGDEDLSTPREHNLGLNAFCFNHVYLEKK
jgi:hypothetical protein